jgi:hypothetical protein
LLLLLLMQPRHLPIDIWNNDSDADENGLTNATD